MAGAGTHLKIMLATARIRPTDACNCEAFAAEMDNRGTAWCRANVEWIVGEMLKEARSRGWPLAGLLGGLAEKLVIAAIEAAERDEQKLAPSQAQFEQLVRDTIEQLRGGVGAWPARWELRPEVAEAHKRLFLEFALRRFDVPEFPRERGIITIAGGTKYFICAYVLIRQLRQLGCRLPVQLYYLGREELDHAMEQLVTRLGGVECVDLVSIVGNEPRRLGGWEAKVWAIMHCPFREVLFLDADNNPVTDPSYLFECREFRDVGAVLWPDLTNQWGYDITTEAFTLVGLDVPGRTRKPDHNKPSDYRPVESGQILVDKSRVWNALNVTRHLNDHSDFWFGEPRGERFWYFYGDKSTFFLGFEGTKTAYAMPRDCEWFGSTDAGGFRQFDFEGRPVLEHRCQPTTKIRLRSEPRTDGMTNGPLMAAACAELRSAWGGVLWAWDHQSAADFEVARSLCGGGWLAYGLPFAGRIELLDAGRVRHAHGFHWRILHHEGRPILVIASAQRAVAFLGRDDKTNWANHEKQQFLAPAPPGDFDMRLEQFEIGLWSDITQRNEYRLPDRIEPGATVVDIGAHVGIFARECLERGAEHVVCVEANNENYSRLYRNLARYGPRVTLIHGACWRSDRTTEWLRLEHKPGAEHSGGGSVVDTAEGQLCRTIGLDEILALVPRRVRLLKIDCEGAEWPILFTASRLDRVDALCGEWHLARLDRAVSAWGLPGLDQAPSPSTNPDYYLGQLRSRLSSAGFRDIELPTNVPCLGWIFARR